MSNRAFEALFIIEENGTCNFRSIFNPELKSDEVLVTRFLSAIRDFAKDMGFWESGHVTEVLAMGKRKAIYRVINFNSERFTIILVSNREVKNIELSTRVEGISRLLTTVYSQPTKNILVNNAGEKIIKNFEGEIKHILSLKHKDLAKQLVEEQEDKQVLQYMINSLKKQLSAAKLCQMDPKNRLLEISPGVVLVRHDLPLSEENEILELLRENVEELLGLQTFESAFTQAKKLVND